MRAVCAHDVSTGRQSNAPVGIPLEKVRNSRHDEYRTIFSNCRRTLGMETWGRVLAALDENATPQTLPETLSQLMNPLGLPDYIGELARIEWARHVTGNVSHPFQQRPATIIVNPTLTLIPVSWSGLPDMIAEADARESVPEPGARHVMIWRHWKTGRMHTREAVDADILALKIVTEPMDPREAAALGHVPVGSIHSVLDQAVSQGILQSPGSRIHRTVSSSLSSQHAEAFQDFQTAEAFTLQWHITQDCDLHCKHCYDRSDRSALSSGQALAVLDDFYEFCRDMHIRGQVTFTGGNPLLYPHFSEIYGAAAERGFGVAILGNPAPIDRIERLMELAKPVYFQISLEGLAEHNDDIRGQGHFRRSLVFLDQLRGLGIYTMVMLTLTRDNLEQVLPLAHLLRERADFFTFNRLSTVGEGARLLMPLKEDFEAFLRRYETAASANPILGLKDNLINIIRTEKGIAPFGGCTGFGCGAAFNFVALLPDGEVHACRKFPSRIGDIRQNRLMEIYHSDSARKYRDGGEACRDCRLSLVCRGCLAVTHSHGLDVFTDRDPFCFLSLDTDAQRRCANDQNA